MILCSRKLSRLAYLAFLFTSWFSLISLLYIAIIRTEPEKFSPFFVEDSKRNPEFPNQREPIPVRFQEKGNGALGKGANLTEEEIKLGEKTFHLHQFNVVASDKLGFYRNTPDFRSAQCKNISYPANLPSLSLIIIFHNEALSTLMRTITSCFYRVNQNLLNEIVLVDDLSNMTELNQLPSLIADETFRSKVKLVRAPSRQGLIKARILGSAHVTGDALVFVDSHCECNEGWAEPILHEILKDYRTAVQPSIGIINAHTFGIGARPVVNSIGRFDWSLLFKWRQIPYHERKLLRSRADTVRTPTMAGGLFGISRRWWEYLGKYDPGFELWGGENLEISIKSWLCGGSVVISPCSIIGHVFRSKHPYNWYKEGPDNAFSVNAKRLAEVWLDEYKQIFYNQAPDQMTSIDMGDISERLQLKKRLNCRPFKWYLEHVVQDMYIPTLEYLKRGFIKVVQSGREQCIDHYGKQEGDAKVFPCHFRKSQYIEYTTANELRMLAETCLEAIGPDLAVRKNTCNLSSRQRWLYSEINGQIRHEDTSLCMSLKEGHDATIVLADCLEQNSLQHWTFT